MTAIIQTILSMITTLLPLVSSAGTATQIGGIIGTITSLLPLVTEEVNTLVPAIKNIIGALQATPTATADQLVALKALDAQCDAAFDAAAADTNAGI